MLSLHSNISISRLLLYAAANFMVLSAIFIWTLMYRIGYSYEVVFQAINLALLATAIYVLVDVVSDGFASMMLIGIYPLAAISMTVLSLVNPASIHDMDDRTSAYRLWSISFWIWFLVGMVVAVSFKILLVYMSKRISSITRSIISDIGNMASNDGSPLNVASILQSLV